MKTTYFTKTFSFLLLLFLLNSCAFHQGSMTGNANLSDNNFKIIQLAIGQAKTTHVLGFGGLNSDALVFEAKRNLYQSFPLKEGQALANITVDFKRSYYLFASTTKVTITADIVDFNIVKEERIQIGIDFITKTNNIDIFENFDIGELVFTIENDEVIYANILSFEDNSFMLIYENTSGNITW